MGERGGGGGGGGRLGLKSDVFFGLQVVEPIIGGVPIYVCVCVGKGGGVGGLVLGLGLGLGLPIYVCVWGGGGGGRGLISGSLLFIFRYRSPFSEESLRCLVAVVL